MTLHHLIDIDGGFFSLFWFQTQQQPAKTTFFGQLLRLIAGADHLKGQGRNGDSETCGVKLGS